MGKNGYDLLLLSHPLAVTNLELCGLKIGIRSCPIGRNRGNGASLGQQRNLKMATKRKISKTELSDAWLNFLQTGQYCGLRELFPDTSNRDHFHIFQHGNARHPVGNQPPGSYFLKLKAIWMQHRDEILTDWRRQKKENKPWVERFFDEQ